MLAIRSLPVSRLPRRICAERCSTNSRLLAKNKTVTCIVKWTIILAFDLCKYKSVNKLIQVDYQFKTPKEHAHTRTVLKRVTISYKINPNVTTVATDSCLV